MQDSWRTRRVHSVPPFTFLCFQTRRCCFSCQSQDWLPMGCTSCSYSQLTRCTSRGMGTTTSRPAAALSPPKSALTLMKMTACKCAVTSQPGTHAHTHSQQGCCHIDWQSHLYILIHVHVKLDVQGKLHPLKRMTDTTICSTAECIEGVASCALVHHAKSDNQGAS